MRIIAITCIYTMLVLLLISTSAGYIPPSESLFVALAGLAFPVLWTLNLLNSILLALFKLKKHVIPVISIMLITSTVMIDYFSIGLNRNVKETKYSILSFNTFGLKKLSDQGKQLQNQSDLHSTLNEKKFSFLCFQEYPMKGYKHAKLYEQLREGLKIPYKALSQKDPDQKATQYIMVTASKYPILGEKVIETNGLPFALCTDILLPEGIIRLYNVHLQSVKFTTERELLLIENDSIDSLFPGNVNNAIKKLTTAFYGREVQTNLLVESIKQSPYPVIITGDFNDTPVSYTYRKLSKSMKDASMFSRAGFKRTYKLSKLPLQIDYILCSKSIHTADYILYEMGISDHYAISTRFRIDQ